MIKPLRLIAATALSLGALAIAAPAAHAAPPLISTGIEASGPWTNVGTTADFANSVAADVGFIADVAGTSTEGGTVIDYPG